MCKTSQPNAYMQKIESDTENFSYNTAVSAFMVCVNELSDLKCHKKSILENLLILLTIIFNEMPFIKKGEIFI
jgi:leucyl-tRNA synthetase